MSYLWYLLGYEDEEEKERWDQKQRERKYEVLKNIKRNLFILNHVHNNSCNCPNKKIENVIQYLKPKKQFRKKY